MTITVQDIVVLIIVAMAAAYVLVRLRRVAAGKSQCACGSKACGPKAAPCGGAIPGANAGNSKDLPMLPPCNQGGGCPLQGT